MKLVTASVTALVVSGVVEAHAYRRDAAGFCDGQLAGNYQHETPESGAYYTCATDDAEDASLEQCPMGDNGNGSEQLVYNPNNGNADCSIVSPGGFCDFSANVDFTSNNGVDAAIDCSTETTTTEAATTTAVEEEEGSGDAEMTPPAGYNADYCMDKSSGNHLFAEACGEGYFYGCSNSMTYLFKCEGEGTVFSPSLGTCDWADNVADCTAPTAPAATNPPATQATTTTVDPAAPTTQAAASEVVSCNWDTQICETTNWCNEKVSGFHVPDDSAKADAGVYYHCNGGMYEELQCAQAGTKWYVPDPLPENVTGWYGWCQ